MTSLSETEMIALAGEGFWGGLACGLGVMTAFVAVTSPDPFSKLALLSYGATAIGCVIAF